MQFGGGVDFYASEHAVLSLGFDDVRGSGDLEDLGEDPAYLSFGWGLQYRF